jgi:hypothetical protein
MKPALLTPFFAALLFLASCKKEGTSLPGPGPVESAHRVAVKLNAGYLPAGKIDSALLTWENNGSVLQQRMQLSNDTLFTEMEALPKGTGRLTIQVFSSVQLRHRNLQWERQMDVTLKEGASVNLTAPVSIDDQEWFPRVIMVDAHTQFTAIVALRPADPFFLLKNIPPGFKIELERNYVAIPGGAVIVGGGLWRCNAVCTDARGIIENRQFFTPLPAQIGNREWKMVEIGIGLFGNNGTAGPGFYFNHY